MVTKGARKLVFLSRSGTSGAQAAEFVARIQSLAVDVQVVCGDVTSLTDVKKAVSASKTPIKGVIQAVLSLEVWLNPTSERLFKARF